MKTTMTHTRGRLNVANPEAGCPDATRNKAGNPAKMTLGNSDATLVGHPRE